MALELIDKQDNFEIIRDKIAVILATETINQQALATAALKDPNDWKLRVYTERSNPFEQWLNIEPPTDKTPIVNVWYESSNFDPAASNISERQKTTGVFYIDCYGYGESSNLIAGGHVPGDSAAAFQAQNAIKLVRNILMAAENTYLQLRGLVWQRWPQSITMFQPQIDNLAAQNVIAARLVFSVIFNELSPQVAPEILELVSVDIKRAEDGEIVIDADYQYPLT